MAHLCAVYTLANLPLGIAQLPGPHGGRAVTAFQDVVIDLVGLGEEGFLPGLTDEARRMLGQPVLNFFMAMGAPARKALRKDLQTLLKNGLPSAIAGHCYPMGDVQMQMPCWVPNYTDFYSSEYHATNVGKLFRPDNPLLPNWKHVPIGYHGRASSVVISGTDVHRPKGQIKLPDSEAPIYGPTRQMDYELETAFVVGKSNPMGQPVPIGEAEDHIFGMLLFNDWSARDIQAWEYQPLGPFGAKNFGSVLSPWIVTMEALEPFRVEGPVQTPEPLPYLRQSGKHAYDITLEVWLNAEGMEEEVLLCRTNQKHLYWTQAQQLAHHTVTGCNLEVGDLCASGTISGPTPGSLGCLLETTRRGQEPVQLPDGSTRTFLLDGDEIILRGYAGEGDARVDFGECRSKVLPALA